MSKVTPHVTDAFRKNVADESFLEEFNAILSASHDAACEDLAEIFPTVFILGVPRSGTTLLSQLLSTHLDVGYINNLIAAFWRVPVYGIRLSQKLMKRNRESGYESIFGRTKGLAEPHEFGYFWSHHLHHWDPNSSVRLTNTSAPDPAKLNEIDWDGLRKVIVNMAKTFAAPVVFKSALTGWYLGQLSRSLTRAVFVKIHRDPYDTAVSLLKLRCEIHGSEEIWGAQKPHEYEWLKDKPVEDQLAGQVHYLNKFECRELSKVSPDRVIHVTYDDLCARPREVLSSVAQLISRHGPKVNTLTLPPVEFEKRTAKPLDPVFEQKLRSAIERFEG